VTTSLPAAPVDTDALDEKGAWRVPALVGWVCAAALTLALTLPMVRADPLHFDESNILLFSPRPLTTLVRDIFVERGGAPLQFIVAHFTLQWPGGTEGLRIPSLLFALLAVVLAGVWGADLVDRGESVALAFLLASAPLAIELATFGRMYGMFLFAVLAASLLSLRAGTRGGKWDWALAGAAAGALVYVHPIAPLYAPFALATGIARSEAPLRSFLPAIRAALIAAAAVAAPYVWALAVLTRRYDVGASGTLGSTGDRSVAQESLLGLTPGGGAIAAVAVVLAVIGIVSIRRDRPRVALLLGLWVVVPIVFFSVVSANTRFFVRYVVITLPPFLLLVAAGTFAIGRWVGRPVLVGGSVIIALVGFGVLDDARHVQKTRAVAVARLVPLTSIPRALLLSSTGSPISDRPPEHLDTYVALRRPGIDQLEELPSLDPRFDPKVAEHGRAAVVAYLRRTRAPSRGVWIFRGPERRVVHAERALDRIPGVESRRASKTLLVIRSSAPLPPRRLIEQSVQVRQAWSVRSPSDTWVDVLIEIDRAALAAARTSSSDSPGASG